MTKRKRKEIVSGNAELTVYGRDMFWYFCGGFFDANNKLDFVHARWQGYNDDYWWNKVAPNQSTKVFTSNKGEKITLKIDFKTNKVIEVAGVEIQEKGENQCLERNR